MTARSRSALRSAFTRETAAQKVRMEKSVEHADPERVSLAYTPTAAGGTAPSSPSAARDRAIPQAQMARELDYRLSRAVDFEAARIAVRFAYEWRDDSGQWFRCTETKTGRSTRTGSCPALREHQRPAHRGDGAQVPCRSPAPRTIPGLTRSACRSWNASRIEPGGIAHQAVFQYFGGSRRSRIRDRSRAFRERCRWPTPTPRRSAPEGAGTPATAFAACELRSPEPLPSGFIEFNGFT